VVRASDF